MTFEGNQENHNFGIYNKILHISVLPSADMDDQFIFDHEYNQRPPSKLSVELRNN